VDSLFLAGAFSDKSKAAKVAESIDGLLLLADADDTAHLPFAALVIGVSDTLEWFLERADIGAYLVCERAVKNLPLRQLRPENKPAVVGIFTMVANNALGPLESDRHWRDVHGPLALRVHLTMTHYYQLAVLQRFKGPDWNGFALCCCATADDLRHRFYDSPEGQTAIASDVATFADPRKSPRRVIASMANC
jgi:hypothetical protein